MPENNTPINDSGNTTSIIKEKLKKPVHPYLAYGLIIGFSIILSLLFLMIFKLNYHPIYTINEEKSPDMYNSVITSPMPSATPTELEKSSTEIDSSLTQSDQDLTNIDNALNDQMDSALQQ